MGRFLLCQVQLHFHRDLHHGRVARGGEEEGAEEEGNRMEQITRKDGVFYYGNLPCRDADDAYCRFRDDYHRSIGRQAFERLNRLGQRKERIHERGFVFSGEIGTVHPLFPGSVVGRMLGLVGTSYCRIIGGWDVHCGADEEFERWLE